jgi:uncharacterized membrane protein YgcG
MNPLDLPGPEFLKFYIVFGVVVIALGWWIRHRLQQTDSARAAAGRFREGYYPRESEVFHIAYLRGGATQLAHTARVLEETQTTAGPQDKPVSAPYESEIESELEREGLIFEPAQRRIFVQVAGGALLLMIGMAGAKIAVALNRGRFNVEYLVMLTLLFSVLALLALRPPRITRAARAYLAWAGRAHNGLLSLVNQGRRTTPGEVALCAAIYGLGPLTIEPVTRLKSTLRAEAAKKDGGSGGASGCSSGGSSCGGGCGGGGCGGCGG